MVVPTVAQQLAAIRHTIAKTVIPALAADADFAREQAGLVLASLDWAMDVVDSEYTYELVELADQRELLSGLLALGPATDDDARTVLELAVAPPGGAADLTGLRERTRALKRTVEATFVGLTARDDAAADTARGLVTRAARRQTERELAWARMTGFPRNAAAVNQVLADQSGGHPAP